MRALLMLGCLRPRVALIDVVMPGLDGFALADRIAGLPELSQATLVLVADQRDEQVDRAAEQRGLLVPDKPLSIGEVGTALRRGGGHLPASAAGSRDRRRMVLGHRQNSAYLSRSCWCRREQDRQGLGQRSDAGWPQFLGDDRPIEFDGGG